MILIGCAIGAIVVLYFSGKLTNNFFVTSTKKLSESAIVQRFNSILKTIGERNLDIVKQELIECLDEYSTVKEQQFAFTLAQIRKSKEEIKKQINSIGSEYTNSKYKLDEFISKSRGNTSEAVIQKGAELVRKLKISKTIHTKLKDAERSLDGRESELMSMLNDFNSNLAIKKAEISIMIADSTGIFTGSTIDLRLDSLVKEFQDKVIEGKASQEVHDKLKGENPSSPVDYNECVAEFTKMIK